MSGLTSLRDQLPLLLVLSPTIGFIATSTATWFEPKWIRPLALSNMICTLVLLGGLEWQFEADLARDANTIRLAQLQLPPTVKAADSLIDAHRMLDRVRAERLRHQWFVVDGMNLFPVLLVVVLITLVERKGSSQDQWFFPTLLLFETTSLGALTASDVRVFLFLSAGSALIMSIFISQGGNSARRGQAEQFLLTQFCAGALIMLGFSMLVIGVPWMKMPDSATIPDISWNIVSIVQDIQKWTARNELAFHYASEVFPWMLLVLSLGFAIQSGFFPFHAAQIRVLSESSPPVAVLYLIGSLSAGRMAWLRFVMPLAPDLLAAFDRWMLVLSIVGAAWGAIHALATNQPRQRLAMIFMSLSGIALLGCYAFTRIGMMGAWLMHQQLIVYACLLLMAIDSRDIRPIDRQQPNLFSSGKAFSSHSLILLTFLPILGLFSSGFLIVSELIMENLFLMTVVLFLILLIAVTISNMLKNYLFSEQVDGQKSRDSQPVPGRLILVVSIGTVVSLFPSLLVHQCEPEFARVFRRFEQSPAADSAETHSVEPQQED